MPAKIFPAASERLLEIWDYTERAWGDEQADAYVRGLVEAAENAASQHHLWRPVPDEDLPGIFFMRYSHHYLFFRQLSATTIGIISVLHENMDLPSRLTEDVERDE